MGMDGGEMNDYRFGFNGKEFDTEINGRNNHYDYGFRILNTDLGRFLSRDPLFTSYPWYTPYQFAGNKPIAAIDLDGLEDKIMIFQIVGKQVVKTEFDVEVGELGYGTLYISVFSSGEIYDVNFLADDIFTSAYKTTRDYINSFDEAPEEMPTSLFNLGITFSSNEEGANENKTFKAKEGSKIININLEEFNDVTLAISGLSSGKYSPQERAKKANERLTKERNIGKRDQPTDNAKAKTTSFSTTSTSSERKTDTTISITIFTDYGGGASGAVKDTLVRKEDVSKIKRTRNVKKYK